MKNRSGYSKRTMEVYCAYCTHWIPLQETEFKNVEEGPQGEDMYYFNCKICGTNDLVSRVIQR